MSTTHQELRKTFANFWGRKNHFSVPPSPLVLKEDATTLFTSSGMQPLVRYLEGAPHPLGKRIYNIQPCFRAVDIDEIGDNRHTTFFEMMGNWSLGDYFKKDQLSWAWEFFTQIIALPKKKIYVTVFEGNEKVPKDYESYRIWQQLGVPEDHIHFYGVEKNWWSRAGAPDQMPRGEIGGPDSEIFYEFETPHDKKFGTHCHPNCDCGRFLEIGNSVFIQYRKRKDGALEELPQKNVDFGGGLERILAAINNDPDVFKTDVFKEIITTIEKDTGRTYTSSTEKATMRIIADHMKAAVFLISNGVTVSNKRQGYVLRRLLRRSAVKLNSLEKLTNPEDLCAINACIFKMYDGVYLNHKRETDIDIEIAAETRRFFETLDKGLKVFEKSKSIDGKVAFDLYQSYGFPFEIINELAQQRGEKVSREEFDKELSKHKELSRIASHEMFKVGLDSGSK